MGLFKSIGRFFGGRRAQTTTAPTLSPQQQAFQNFSLPMLANLLSQSASVKPYDFGPVEAQAKTQFATETIPQLAERFTAMGPGSQASSAFQGALGQAGSGLQEGLASQRAGMDFRSQQAEAQRIQGLMGVLGPLAMRPPFENFHEPRQAGVFESMMPEILGGVGSLVKGRLPSILGAPLPFGGSVSPPRKTALGGAQGSFGGTSWQRVLQNLKSGI